MPGSRTHDISGALTAPLFGWGSYSSVYMLTRETGEAALVGGVVFVSHLLGTYYMSPDLDLDSTIYRRWGGLRWVWLPYKNLVKHRSSISHTALGGIIRPLYFITVLATMYLLLAGISQVMEYIFLSSWLKSVFMHAKEHIVAYPKGYLLFGASFCIGSASSSWVHCIMDRWWPFRQERR
jgi:uncharacterized metal-binding protein